MPKPVELCIPTRQKCNNWIYYKVYFPQKGEKTLENNCKRKFKKKRVELCFVLTWYFWILPDVIISCGSWVGFAFECEGNRGKTPSTLSRMMKPPCTVIVLKWHHSSIPTLIEPHLANLSLSFIRWHFRIILEMRWWFPMEVGLQ